MTTLYLILYIVGALAFLLAFLESRAKVAGLTAVHWVAFGLLAWILIPLIIQARHMG